MVQTSVTIRKNIGPCKKKKKGNYDCLVPVSGGKDGTYVAYQLRDKYKMNILTVTVKLPLELETGEKKFEKFYKPEFRTYTHNSKSKIYANDE